MYVTVACWTHRESQEPNHQKHRQGRDVTRVHLRTFIGEKDKTRGEARIGQHTFEHGLIAWLKEAWKGRA